MGFIYRYRRYYLLSNGWW